MKNLTKHFTFFTKNNFTKNKDKDDIIQTKKLIQTKKQIRNNYKKYKKTMIQKYRDRNALLFITQEIRAIWGHGNLLANRLYVKGRFVASFNVENINIEFKTYSVIYREHDSAYVHKMIFNGKRLIGKVQHHDNGLSKPELSPILKKLANEYFTGSIMDKESVLKVISGKSLY